MKNKLTVTVIDVEPKINFNFPPPAPQTICSTDAPSIGPH